MDHVTKAIANVLRRKYNVDLGKTAMVANNLRRAGYTASTLDAKALKIAERRLRGEAQKNLRNYTPTGKKAVKAEAAVRTAGSIEDYDSFWDEERPFMVEAAEYFRSCDRCRKPCRQAVKLADDDVRMYPYCTECRIAHVPTADEDVVKAG